MREKLVTVLRRSPLVLRLPPGRTELPWFGVAHGKQMNSNGNGNLNDTRGNGVMNWLRYFQDERDIWVQNVSNTQLSLQFEVAQGQIQGVLIPMGGDPICLTQEVPYDAIKKSMDFRRFLNRQPTIMKAMDDDEVQSYYKKKAEDMKAFVQDKDGKLIPNVQAALAAADADRKSARSVAPGEVSTYTDQSGQVAFTPPRSAQELMGLQTPHMGVSAAAAQAAGLQQVPQGFVNGPAVGATGGNFGISAAMLEQPVMADQIINPRILHLCQQVSSSIPTNMRMPADQFFRELKPLEASLSVDDLQYVQSHGLYPTVKKWAGAILDQRAPSTEENAGL
jgi:hypothetical protein